MLYTFKEAFPEMHKLTIISLSLPFTSASAERTFSKLRQIKTYLRNRMSTKRLSNLAIHKIDLDVFVDEFANNHENRRIKLH